MFRVWECHQLAMLWLQAIPGLHHLLMTLWTGMQTLSPVSMVMFQKKKKRFQQTQIIRRQLWKGLWKYFLTGLQFLSLWRWRPTRMRSLTPRRRTRRRGRNMWRPVARERWLSLQRSLHGIRRQNLQSHQENQKLHYHHQMYHLLCHLQRDLHLRNLHLMDLHQRPRSQIQDTDQAESTKQWCLPVPTTLEITKNAKGWLERFLIFQYFFWFSPQKVNEMRLCQPLWCLPLWFQRFMKGKEFKNIYEIHDSVMRAEGKDKYRRYYWKQKCCGKKRCSFSRPSWPSVVCKPL